MRLRYKSWSDQLVSENKNIAFREDEIEKIDKVDLLEIGSGLGEFAIDRANKYSDLEYLGVEVCYTAFAISVKKLLNYQEENNCVVTNLKFLNANVDKLFPHLKENSLKAIYLNFNDPWLKNRQHKRRLTYPTYLSTYYRYLQNDGIIYFKTDNDIYYEYSKQYFRQVNCYDVIFIDDYKLDDEDYPSEYEKKFKLKNKSIHRIIARKK